ncbi:MAG TPA: hypothetical protein VGM33_16850 [Baekduia sp.]
MMLLRRAGTALVSAAALLAVAAIPAGAAPDPVAIGGSPLTVWVGNQGQLQAKRDTDTSNIFYSPTSQLGDAGFFLAFPDLPDAPAQQAPLAGKVFGFDGSAGPHLANEYTPLVPPATTTGTGSATSPHTLVTPYAVDTDDDANDATPAVRKVLITQTTTYVDGAQVFDVKWDVRNVSGAPLRFKAISAADFYFEGSDKGTGIFTQGPPRFVGGTNADTGRSGGFVEVAAPGGALPWSRYQALQYEIGGTDDVWGRVRSAAASATPSYDDSILGEPVDNAGAVEWDQYLDPTTTLADNAVAKFELLVRTALPAALQFDQTNAGAPQGVPITFTVTAKDTADVPFAGKNLVSTITGANAGTQTAVIGPAGTATVVDPGALAGADTVISFVDLNGDGAREPNEPQGSALATFVDHTPPQCAVKVTGDRPGGGGGAGKPLVITVNCDSTATVTTASSLSIQPLTPKAKPKPKAKHKTKAHKSASAAKAKAKPKHKSKAKPKKPKKPKKVTVRLPGATTLVQPGQALPVNLAIPASVTKKYPGATATATIVVTATDTAGNVATSSATKKVLIAKPKPKKKAKPKHKSKAKHKAPAKGKKK